MSAFAEAVSRVVAALAPGEVVSYGEVAAEAGSPGAARAVGRVLRDSDGLPWWRVVTADGRLVPGLEAEHARRLAAEGVAVRGSRVTGARRWVGRPLTTDQQATDQETTLVEPDPAAAPDPQDRDVAEQAVADEERRAEEERIADDRNAAQRAAGTGEQSIVMKPEGEAAATKRLTGDSDPEDP